MCLVTFWRYMNKCLLMSARARMSKQRRVLTHSSLAWWSNDFIGVSFFKKNEIKGMGREELLGCLTEIFCNDSKAAVSTKHHTAWGTTPQIYIPAESCSSWRQIHQSPLSPTVYGLHHPGEGLVCLVMFLNFWALEAS